MGANITSGNNSNSDKNFPDFQDEQKFKHWLKREKNGGKSLEEVKDLIRKAWARTQKGAVEPRFYDMAINVFGSFTKSKSLNRKEKKQKIQLISKLPADWEIVNDRPTGRLVYDYIGNIPILGHLGTFRVPMKDWDGNTIIDANGEKVKGIERHWFDVRGLGDLDKEIYLRTPKQDPGMLMHYPIYGGKIRKAKIGQLFLHVKKEVGERVSFEGTDILDTVSVWTIATHYTAVFDHFPILDLFKAGYNAGGSVALKTILSYCPRPWLVQNPTPAALFRYTDDLKPTVGIEEFTTDTPEDVRNAEFQILDGSFDKNVQIPRTERGLVAGYDLYGPKAVVDPQGLFSRYSTASRTLFAPLVNNPGFQSDADDILKRDAEFIQTLYDSFLIYANRVRHFYEHCRITGDGRVDQAFRPLVAVALLLKTEGVDVVDSVMHVIQQQFENLQVIKTEGDLTKQILSAIYDLVSYEESEHRWFRQSGDLHYIRLSNLKNVISNSLSVEFQSDTNSRKETRYWKRPPKEIAEILSDSKRFASILKTFLPSFVDAVEPGSRNLCLCYNGTADQLKDRLTYLIGFKPDSYNLYKILHVGLHTDAVISNIINNKFLQSYKKRKRDMIEGKKDTVKTCPPFLPFCRILANFDFLTLYSTGSRSNPTSLLRVGFGQTVELEDSENTGSNGNLTIKKIDDHSGQELGEWYSKSEPSNKITEDEGRGIIGQLLKEGIHVNPNDSGVSLVGKNFKIAIPTPHDSERKAKIESRMRELGFEQVNRGDYGPLFFRRPLRRGSA